MMLRNDVKQEKQSLFTSIPLWFVMKTVHKTVINYVSLKPVVHTRLVKAGTVLSDAIWKQSDRGPENTSICFLQVTRDLYKPFLNSWGTNVPSVSESWETQHSRQKNRWGARGLANGLPCLQPLALESWLAVDSTTPQQWDCSLGLMNCFVGSQGRKHTGKKHRSRTLETSDSLNPTVLAMQPQLSHFTSGTCLSPFLTSYINRWDQISTFFHSSVVEKFLTSPPAYPPQPRGLWWVYVL